MLTDAILRLAPAEAHPLDLEARALWHLELLGCYVPSDAAVPCVPPPVLHDERVDDDWNCTHCGGEGFREVDDIWWDDCDQGGWGPCTSCHGTGERRRQWVF